MTRLGAKPPVEIKRPHATERPSDIPLANRAATIRFPVRRTVRPKQGRHAMASNTAADLYATALGNTRALEQQGLQQMEQQVSGLERYPDYARVLHSHIETTKGQIARLDAAMAAAGTSASSFKEAVTSVAGSVGAAVHALAPDETLKNLFAGYAFQYDQIAAYRSLIVMAEAAGQTGQVAAFRTSVDEERRAADEIDAMIETITRRYLSLAAEGHKAGR